MATVSSPPKRSRESDSGSENETARGPAKRPRCDYGDTVSILVGPEEQSFIVHKDMICSTSKFFKAACSAIWKEGKEEIIRLPTAKPSVFEKYLDWVYSNRVASNLTGCVTSPLVDLYLLGDVVDDKGLRNKVMATLQDRAYKAKRILGTSDICRIWESTAEGSLLRKWAFDSCFLRSGSRFEESLARWPPELVQQIAVKLMRFISSAAFLAKSEEYQETDDEEA